MKPQAIEMGKNLTGMSMHPVASRAMLENTEDLLRTEAADGDALRRSREEFTSAVGIIGTMPPPLSLKGAASTAVETIKGQKPVVLLDALGDRSAFERTGIRLYEALIAKVNAIGSFEGGPALEELERIRQAEMEHFKLLYEAMESLGADPTAQTPTADVSGVLAQGLVQVLVDPRTSVPQALHAVHTAELVDNDSWLMLSELATSMGHEELAERFHLAESEEAEHLRMVRAWMRSAQLADALMAFETSAP
jgi:rubrerythrin